MDLSAFLIAASTVRPAVIPSRTIFFACAVLYRFAGPRCGKVYPSRMEDEVRWLICAVYHGHWEIDVYKESVIRRATCGHLVWVAAAGQRVWDDAYPLCEECFLASDLPNDTNLESAPGAMEDIERLFGAERAREALADFNSFRARWRKK